MITGRLLRVVAVQQVVVVVVIHRQTYLAPRRLLMQGIKNGDLLDMAVGVKQERELPNIVVVTQITRARNITVLVQRGDVAVRQQQVHQAAVRIRYPHPRYQTILLMLLQRSFNLVLV